MHRIQTNITRKMNFRTCKCFRGTKAADPRRFQQYVVVTRCRTYPIQKDAE